jgi:hypothetical protein
VKTARIVCGLLAAWAAWASSPVFAQNVAPAAPINPPPANSAGTSAYVAPPLSSAGPAPAAAPGSPAATFAPPGTAPATGSAGAAPGLIYTPPPNTAVVAPAASAAQPPTAAFDPYATPGNAPSPLLQQDPYLSATAVPTLNMASMQKFIKAVNLNYDWFAGHGEHELGINDVDLNVTLSFPIFSNVDPGKLQTPLLVTPGFAVHYWEGPVSMAQTSTAEAAPADMPPRTYDAYLDFAWNPNISDSFGVELNFRTGVFSDFYMVTTESIRYMGKGMAVIRLSPSFTLKAGVWYLDRVTTKLLPAGGIVWNPNPDVCFDILFPNPRIARRLTTWGTTDWWLYARGEYGGGVWTVQRNTDIYNGTHNVSDLNPNGFFYPKYSHDLVDYNDIRVAVGLEFKTPRQMEGHFEAGLSCSRQLNYLSGLPASYYPRNTVFIGGGLSY